MMGHGECLPLGNGLGQLPDPVTSATAVVDARGTVTGWSIGAQRLLGYPYQDVVGRPAARWFGCAADAPVDFSALLEGRGGITAAAPRRPSHGSRAAGVPVTRP